MAFQLFEGEIGTVKQTSHDTLSIHTEVTIEAAPEVVWAVLTDWEKLAEWSEGLINLTGDFKLGGEVVVTFKLGIGEHTQDFTHILKTFEAGRTFGWSDPFLMGMVDHHIYRVEPLPNGRSRFIQTDQVKGFAGHFVGVPIARNMMHNYVEFNRALKARVEGMDA